jgi:phage terminase large subunit-like protein
MPAEELEKAGLQIISMPQTYLHFNEPIHELQSALADGRVVHEADKERDSLFRWCASNAVVVQDRNDRRMYDKAASKFKIDPIVAATMALKAAMKAPRRARGSLFIC